MGQLWRLTHQMRKGVARLMKTNMSTYKHALRQNQDTENLCSVSHILKTHSALTKVEVCL